MKHPKFCILSFLWECNDIEDKLNGVERKWPGHESTYECRYCGGTLCVDLCFYIYHNYKDYMGRYIEMKKQ